MKTQFSSSILFRLFAIAICVHLVGLAQGQKVLNTPLTTNTVVTDPKSILLTSGFATNGFTFHASVIMGESYTLNVDGNRNYILSIIPQVASTKLGVNTFIGTTRRSDQVSDQITYFNALGNPIQSINVNASPAGKDIVTPFTYDEFGREKFKNLPYTTDDNNGNYIDGAINAQASFYNGLFGSGTPAYANTVIEASPLNRVLEQGAPGAFWQPAESNLTGSGHTVKYEYAGNTQYDVLILKVNNAGSCVNAGGESSGSLSYYPSAQLYKTIIKDENWTSGKLHTTEEYKDKAGNLVLKRTFVENSSTSAIDNIETYYVYDDYGLLRYVLSPKAVPLLSFPVTSSNNIIQSLCYCYGYDDLNRMIIKQLPGASAVYMVYDNRDRLVLSQDGEQRIANQWICNLYDQLNRSVITGFIRTTVMHGQLQSDFSNFYQNETVSSSGNIGYTLSKITPSLQALHPDSILTIAYYDSYSFPDAQAFDATNNISGYTDSEGSHTTYFDNVIEMVTGGKTRVLGTSTLLTSTSYYDDKLRVIQNIRSLYDGSNGIETLSSEYDFVGKALYSRQYQKFGSTETSVDKYYSYDHAGRLTKVEQQIGSNRNTVSQMSYNELGQLSGKNLGGLQEVNYDYNIRGWLTQINNPDNLNGDLFAMRLGYNNPESGLSNNGQFNGNISSMVWNSTQKTKQGYAFAYDGLNRLNNSDYKTNGGSAWNESAAYEEKSIQYDFNGNINKLLRTNSAQAPLNDFTYFYNGNQLQSINSGSLYTYDANGNTKKDGLREFEIDYNLLNLPQRISKTTGTVTESISYIYSASGEKLAKKMKDNKYQYYAGSMVYNDDKSLNYLLFEEGRVKKVGGGYSYEYSLKDHLGNSRVTFEPNGGNTNTLQVAEYYPFGSSFTPTSPNNDNKYLYNGKELQDETLGGVSLGLYDYGARFYDITGRFTTMDPMAEQYPWQWVWATRLPSRVTARL